MLKIAAERTVCRGGGYSGWRGEGVGAFAVEGVERPEGVGVRQPSGRVQNAQLVAERRQQAHQRALHAPTQPLHKKALSFSVDKAEMKRPRCVSSMHPHSTSTKKH